jgi:hypothetical protein
MLLQKCKNYPKMASFLLSAENPEHALEQNFSLFHTENPTKRIYTSVL